MYVCYSRPVIFGLHCSGTFCYCGTLLCFTLCLFFLGASLFIFRPPACLQGLVHPHGYAGPAGPNRGQLPHGVADQPPHEAVLEHDQHVRLPVAPAAARRPRLGPIGDNKRCELLYVLLFYFVYFEHIYSLF